MFHNTFNYFWHFKISCTIDTFSTFLKMSVCISADFCSRKITQLDWRLPLLPRPPSAIQKSKETPHKNGLFEVARLFLNTSVLFKIDCYLLWRHTLLGKKYENNCGKQRLWRPNFKRPEVIGSNHLTWFKKLISIVRPLAHHS